MTASRVRAAVTAASLSDEDEGVTALMYRALVVLARRGPSRTADLANSFGVDWATTPARAIGRPRTALWSTCARPRTGARCAPTHPVNPETWTGREGCDCGESEAW